MISKIGILSDIHGNLPALRAVLEDVRREKCTKVYVLGDIINGIDPQGSTQYLLDWKNENEIELICIKGNAEAYLLTPNRNSIPIQEEWHLDVIRLIQWYEDQLSEQNLAWIRTFPMTVRRKETYFVHDSPLDRIAVQQTNTNLSPEYREWYYHGEGILPEMGERKWQKILDFMHKEAIAQLFCGHTHVPFCKEIDGKRIYNVGSVGAPLDGDPRASWIMLLEDTIGNQTVTIRRVEYDVSEILQKVDGTLDYPDFKTPEIREAYKKWYKTGIHWRAHYSNVKT